MRVRHRNFAPAFVLAALCAGCSSGGFSQLSPAASAPAPTAPAAHATPTPAPGASTPTPVPTASPGGSVSLGASPQFSSFTIANFPALITAGADGNLWYTNGAAPPALSSITTAGTETVFPIGGAQIPNGIASGPGGALWFVEPTGNAIGSITTAGVLGTVFPIPNAGAKPLNLAVGPDGNLWFGGQTDNAIGRMTPNGTFTLVSGRAQFLRCRHRTRWKSVGDRPARQQCRARYHKRRRQRCSR